MLCTPQNYENEPPTLVANGTIAVEGNRPDKLKSKDSLVNTPDVPVGDSNTTTDKSFQSAINAGNLQNHWTDLYIRCES